MSLTVNSAFISTFIRLTMMQVATRYLKNVEMNAELTVKDTWTK